MNTKYKILLASETYPPDVNGAAIFVQRLAIMLSEKGNNVLVIAPSPTHKERLEEVGEHLKCYRVKTVSLKPIHPYFRAVFDVGLTKKIKRMIHDFQPDVIHIQNHFLLGRTCLKVARQKQIPIMGTNHFMPDNLTEYFPGILEKSVAQYMWKDFLHVYNKLDYVTAPTHAALSMITNLGLTAPSQVISNGIDLQEFSKVHVQKRTFKRFNLKANVPIFLFVGRLEKDKNIDMVLKAIELNKNSMDIQMVIAGRGRDEHALKKITKRLRIDDQVFFVGKVSDNDLKQLYAIATVYVGSGIAELQGLAVMEAMANGLPILAVNAVALPELVRNGINGYLFENTPEDLAHKMQLILRDQTLLLSMGRQSRTLIQRHSKEQTAISFLQIYEMLIEAQHALPVQTKAETRQVV